ncbi:MAG: mechanosensitive ion channel protein MscS [Ignavibacteriae bacterium HGW-Ignavibacteriae-2]|jgi:small-conductance mechanosensitive channel|nr:MAG: mechanosensitive ion channel protein MscS [Ignavibacteriae bacterium HGW-Ignavibacteriae-2]
MDIFIDRIKEVISFPLFTINQTQVSLLSLIILVFIILLFTMLSKSINNRILQKFFSKFKLDEGIQYTLTKIAQYIIISAGVVLAFQFIGVDLSGLAVILGFLSVGIGFGLQNITSNFISGIILLFERPIRVGDRVTVGETEGDVTNISIRATSIRSVNNISIIVPNSEFISGRVINWTHGDKKIRIDLEIGVSYNSDLDLVLRVLKEIAVQNAEVLESPEPEVHLKTFGDSSWNMHLRVWIPNPKRFHYVRSELNCAIVRKFKEHNIEIPFPQRDIHIRSNNSEQKIIN